MKKVLITGAQGFIGRYAVAYFSTAGWHVTGIDEIPLSEEDIRHLGVNEWHAANVDLDALNACGVRPDLILHCAGSGTVGYSLTCPYEDCRRNVHTTLSVLEFARRQAPQARIIYPSSAAVYGDVDRIPISERAELKPIAPYGVHKRMAEDLCQSYARNFGLSVAIIRLFSVYGPGLRKQLLWDACTKISNNENGFWGSGAETRDWLHVEDAVSLFMTASAHASSECPIVNGGFGIGTQIRDLISELFECFGRADSPVFLNVGRTGDPVSYVADIERATMWGWNPRRGWRQGIREYADWFKDNTV